MPHISIRSQLLSALSLILGVLLLYLALVTNLGESPLNPLESIAIGLFLLLGSIGSLVYIRPSPHVLRQNYSALRLAAGLVGLAAGGIAILAISLFASFF